VLVTLLAYSVPRVYLGMLGRQRSRDFERGLPMAVDLLNLCLSVGQNVHAAFHRVGYELRSVHPVLASEMAITYQQAELSSLELALTQMAARVQVPEVRNLALILAQSERLGTDAVTTLEEFATSFRTTLRQRAEAHANR